MARPTDWTPLADKDPIGGDLAGVQREAKHYTDLAHAISEQVTRLHKIAGNHDQVGKSADKLREKAKSTADTIGKTHKRVSAVAEALTSWIPQLDTAQTDTLSALNAAKDAVHRQAANANPPAGSTPPKTDAEKSADKARSQRLSEADGDLEAARKKFENAVSTRDSDAKKVAAKIHDGLHDGLNDSWWDSFSDWVSQHVKMIKMIVDVISWVATALALVALFVPGLNILAAAFLAATLLGHALLAATGNGSWTDVALDVVGLLTFRLGAVAGDAVKADRAATLAAAAKPAAERAAGVAADSRAELQAFYKAGESGLLRNVYSRSPLFKVVSDFKVAGAASRAESEMLTRELPEVGGLKTLVNDGKEIAQNAVDRASVLREYGDDPAVRAAAGDWGRSINYARASTIAGQVPDMGNHLASKSDIPGFDRVLRGAEPWMHFKQLTTLGVAGATGAGEG